MTYKFKITPIFKINIKDGKTSMSDDEYFRYRKMVLSLEGDYEFIVKKKFKKRSLPQNAYFHGVIVPMIADSIGEQDQNEIKAILKSKFLSKEKPLAGKDNQWEMIKIVGRTSKLSTDNFSIFVEKCRTWASSFLGINIPDPDPEHAAHAIMYDED